jgi:endonuclease/exonuclease/phosphatase family metal-dependent hydrolase
MGVQASFSRSYPRRLRLLSYNIQSGIYTRHFGEYVTSSWKHVLPHPERLTNLNRIAGMLHGFDVVGLQEVDSGSLRSGFIDQTEYLAHRAHFPYWYKQVNRRLGKIAQHSNGMLSRLRPAHISEYKLPGLPGRGALLIEFDTTDAKTLGVCILHLALGRRARRRQLAFVTELVAQFPYLVLMGDFNCDCSSREFQRLVNAVSLQGLDCGMKTFPSWRPRRNLDHILASSTLKVLEAEVVDYPLSDHLPVSMEVILPWGVGVVT